MVDSGPYVAITVVPGPSPHSAIGCSSPQQGLPPGEAAWRALAGRCLLTVLLAVEQQLFPGPAALGDISVFTSSRLHFFMGKILNLTFEHILGKGSLEVEPLGQMLLHDSGLGVHCAKKDA